VLYFIHMQDDPFAPRNKAKNPKPMDAVAFIMAYETGELSETQIIRGFQKLIDTEVVWHLQGSYQRMAVHLIEEGHCKARKAGFSCGF
jgi:hypothetical protein